MSKKKKIALCVLLSVLCIICLFEIVYITLWLVVPLDRLIFTRLNNVVQLILISLLFAKCLLAMIRIIRNKQTSNAKHFVRYTYEEYKAYRDKKKVEKQEKKKAKLQKQLQEIEKTE